MEHFFLGRVVCPTCTIHLDSDRVLCAPSDSDVQTTIEAFSKGVVASCNVVTGMVRLNSPNAKYVPYNSSNLTWPEKAWNENEGEEAEQILTQALQTIIALL